MVQHRFHAACLVCRINISGDEVGNSGDVPVVDIGGAKFAEVLLLVVDEVLSAGDEMSRSRTYDTKLQTHVAWTP